MGGVENKLYNEHTLHISSYSLKMLHYFSKYKVFYKVIKSFQCFPINFKSYDNLNICLNDLSFITFKFSKHSFYKLLSQEKFSF